MSDLFDYADKYPNRPGFKEGTTSRDAALRIAPRAQTLRDQVMIAYRAAWPAGLTADEVASKVGKSILSIRPRVTELRKLGWLMACHAEPHPGGKMLTRPNESGVEAAVLVCKKPEDDQ